MSNCLIELVVGISGFQKSELFGFVKSGFSKSGFHGLFGVSGLFNSILLFNDSFLNTNNILII
jgi:hypothetical protein